MSPSLWRANKNNEEAWPPFAAGDPLEGFFARYPGYKSHLKNIERAAHYGHLAGLVLRDRQSGAPVPVVVAVVPDGQGNVEFFPLARLFTGNPYEELIGPGDEVAPRRGGQDAERQDV